MDITSTGLEKFDLKKENSLGNAITLRYFVELQRKPGKENANLVGYNYTKDEIYKIPHNVKIIKIESYEDRKEYFIFTQWNIYYQL